MSRYLTLTYEDIAIAVQATLNSLLEDDVLKKRYVSGIFPRLLVQMLSRTRS